jgi:hypothetical protein
VLAGVLPGLSIYIDQKTFNALDDEYELLINMLNSMERNAEKFCF